jgi:hypothetical protein
VTHSRCPAVRRTTSEGFGAGTPRDSASFVYTSPTRCGASCMDIVVETISAQYLYPTRIMHVALNVHEAKTSLGGGGDYARAEAILQHLAEVDVELIQLRARAIEL